MPCGGSGARICWSTRPASCWWRCTGMRGPLAVRPPGPPEPEPIERERTCPTMPRTFSPNPTLPTSTCSSLRSSASTCPRWCAPAQQWYNQTLCRVNESVVRLGVVQGEYHWHKHDEDDEFFYVVDGRFWIDLPDRVV